MFFPDKNEERTREILLSVDEEVFVYGHSHGQWYLRSGEKVGVNPGSLAFPLRSSLNAQLTIMQMASTLSINQWSIAYDNRGFAEDFLEESFFSKIGPIGKAAHSTLLTGTAVLMAQVLR